MNRVPALIGGKPVDTDDVVDVEDPSTGEVFAATAECGPAEVDLAVSAAREAQTAWRRVGVPARAELLRRLSVLIKQEVAELGRIESRQTGKPLRQGVRDAEITARYFDFYASAVEMLYGTTFSLDEHISVQTRFQPHGVTAHIIPWNYPLQITARSVAPSLAMGNCCVVKPAEEAPLTALRIGELALEAGFPAGALNVVTGRGEPTGAALAAHHGVDHISFTGSVEVGRLIGRAAAERIVPVTLELGGKSPNLVFADADIERAVPVIANSILQNAGQTCSAGSRLLVHESVHAEVVERLKSSFASLRVGNALDDPDLGPLITGPQRDRVASFVDEARDATVVTGGQPLEGPGYFYAPTIIDGVAPGTPMFCEEVFGPVLAVTAFSDTDEAVELANGTDYGLVSGVWTSNVSTAERMLRELVFGQVFVNTYGASGGVELPFGGFKRSGFGREKGFEGLRGFAQVKTGIISS